MKISPDEIVFFKIPVSLGGHSFDVDINMTLVGTWLIMLGLFFTFRHITRNFNADFKMTRLQNMTEVLIKSFVTK